MFKFVLSLKIWLCNVTNRSNESVIDAFYWLVYLVSVCDEESVFIPGKNLTLSFVSS